MNRQNVALSGIAMILIVLNHTIQLEFEYATELGYSLQYGLNYYILWIMQALGSFAVPIFLFISGSFVAYAAKGDPPKLTLKFLQSSLLHILLPYFIWSVIFYFVLYVNHGTMFSFATYGRNLIVGYPFHFIPLLVFFYLVSPFLIPIGKRFPWILIIGFLIYQVFLLNIKYPGTLGFVFPSWMNIFVIPILGNTMADWGVCFPLGILFNINSKNIRPWLLKFKWLFWGLTIVSFSLALLNAQNIITAPIARFIGPILFLFVIPVINRNSILAVRRFEDVGKRSYGIYLTHLIILDSLYLIISKIAPQLFQFSGLLTPFLLISGISIPIFLMSKSSKSSLRKYYRYIFG